MGSFNVSCCVTGLPILGGTKVVAFLLTESPYAEERGCPVGIHHYWYLRTPPMRATYADCGRIESSDKGMKALWVEGLTYDMIERGVGDNTYHDVATRKDMTWDETMEAIQCGRLLVQRDLQDLHHISADRVKELGEQEEAGYDAKFPTMKRVEVELRRAFPLIKGLLVDEKSPGHVRVRAERASDAKDKTLLRKIQPILALRWNVVLTRDHSDIVLWVVPPPESKHELGYAGAVREERDSTKPSLRIALCLVREDVFRLLVALTPTSPAHKAIRKDLSDLQAFYTENPEPVIPLELSRALPEALRLLREYRMFHDSGTEFLDSLPFAFGVQQHLALSAKAGHLTQDRIKELVRLHRAYATLCRMNYQWRSAAYAGQDPQKALFHAFWDKLTPKIRWGRR